VFGWAARSRREGNNMNIAATSNIACRRLIRVVKGSVGSSFIAPHYATPLNTDASLMIKL